MRPGRSGDQGFTLLEVLIAFIIAALALGELFSVAAGELGAVAVAGRYQEALSRVRSHLAAVGVIGTLVAGEQQGDDGGGYHWTLRIVPIAATASRNAGSALAGSQTPRAGLYFVTASVSWQENGRARSVRLTTERVAPAAPIRP